MVLLNYGHFVAPPTVPAWQVAAGGSGVDSRVGGLVGGDNRQD